MTKAEQVQFIKELSASVTKQLEEEIMMDKIPLDWNGIELRQLLAERFNRSTFKMDRRRMKAYNNAVVVNNL
jgi:hypothetical protein